MKKLAIGCISALLVTFILFSCSKNHTKELARTWTVTEIESQTSLPDSVQAKMISNSVMVFTKDGHYNTNGGIGADQGTYSIDKEGKNLSTVSEAGKGNQVYSIDKLSDEKLVLTQNGNTITCIAKN